MGKIVINIKDKSKEQIIISLLKELSFIEVKELKKKAGQEKLQTLESFLEFGRAEKFHYVIYGKNHGREEYHDFV